MKIRLKLEYVIEDPLNGDILTKAYSIQVAVDALTQEMQFCSPKKLIDSVSDYLVNKQSFTE